MDGPPVVALRRAVAAWAGAAAAATAAATSQHASQDALALMVLSPMWMWVSAERILTIRIPRRA